MQKKYFFFDIDGTLTDRRTNTIVPSAREALNQLEAAGHFVALATGRAAYKAYAFFSTHHFRHMVCNGGHGLYMDGILVENRPLNHAEALALYRETLDAGYGALVAIDDSQAVYAQDFTFYDQSGPRLEPTIYHIDACFNPGDHPIYKMYISVPIGEEDHIPMLPAMMAPGSPVGTLRLEPPYLVIQPDEKKAGILKLLALAGGDPEAVVVFGDDTNDVAMFDSRFTKVAMGNACDSLKALADIIAPTNIDDGIYRVCEAQGWL